MLPILLGTVLPWLFVAVGAWLGLQLIRQNGRILLRLESIDKRLSPRGDDKPKPERGLRVGTAAPDFELPDLSGERHKLSDFRGKDLLLIFFNPKCGFCTKMADDLAALPLSGENGRPVPVIVTTGDLEANRKLVEQYRLRGVVLRQEAMEVASQFHAQGTPMGYRLDAEGRIASELAVGAEALLKLAGGVMGRGSPDPTQLVNGAPKRGDKDYRSLAASRLNRQGLKAGERAPDFRLPRIDGGELALEDFQGRRVLLVFSDPHCGPCAELAPRLEEIHLERAELNVLAISRGDVEENRAKAAALGLSFPIVLQQKWEVSLKYAMFATPIGYLIDEEGILLSDVAVGVEPILALAGVQALACAPGG
jgi:peroxiredoxin